MGDIGNPEFTCKDIEFFFANSNSAVSYIGIVINKKELGDYGFIFPNTHIS